MKVDFVNKFASSLSTHILAFGSTILRAAGTSVAFAIRIGRREATTVPFVTAAFSK
jgi:hypothetical protein